MGRTGIALRPTQVVTFPDHGTRWSWSLLLVSKDLPAMQKLTLSLLLPAMLAGAAFAQCNVQPPITTAVGANGQKGAMFNIVNTSTAAVTIQSFEQRFLAAGTSDVEIYTIAGTWQGFENTAAAWTLVGTALAMPHTVRPALDLIPVPVNVTIPGGATQGFYITCTNSTGSQNVSYTTGVNQINAVFATDGLVNITGGPGKAYPFSTNFGLPTAGRLWDGRVTYCVSGTPATNTVTGLGCVRGFTSFYESFAAPANFDLGGSAITMIPGGGGYTVTTGGTFLPIGSVQATPTALALGDDAGIAVPFTTGSFQGPAGPWTGVYVISNGAVCQAAGNILTVPVSSTVMLAAPQTAFYTTADFDPIGGTGAGTIWYEESASVVSVTWDNVASWNNPGSTNTFQMQLYPSGVVTIVWTALAAVGSNGGVLVGYSPAGASADPGNTDISALGAGSIVLPATDTLPLTLAATSRAVTGGNWGLNVTNIPVTGVLGIDIFGVADPAVNDLGFLGMPGCGLRATLDSLNAYIPAGTSHAYGLAIPAVPALVGQNFHTTSAMFVPGVNAFGAITSNGITATIGDA